MSTFIPWPRVTLSARKCGHRPGGSETAVEQLDALGGERPRTDVGRRTLRPTADKLRHRNKGDRTINKPGQLFEITERVRTALRPQDIS